MSIEKFGSKRIQGWLIKLYQSERPLHRQDVRSTNETWGIISITTPCEITRLLQGPGAKGLLERDGYGRWASYRLSARFAKSAVIEGVASHRTSDDSQHNEASSQHSEENSQHNDPVLVDEALLVLAAPARLKSCMTQGQMREIIRHRKPAFLTERVTHRFRTQSKTKALQVSGFSSKMV